MMGTVAPHEDPSEPDYQTACKRSQALTADGPAIAAHADTLLGAHKRATDRTNPDSGYVSTIADLAELSDDDWDIVVQAPHLPDHVLRNYFYGFSRDGDTRLVIVWVEYESGGTCEFVGYGRSIKAEVPTNSARVAAGG